MKRTRKFLLCAFLGLLLLSCGLLSNGVPAVNEPPGEEGNIELVRNEDAQMNAAIQQAQDSLPVFIQAFELPSPTMTYFSIKVRFYSGEQVEHIWLYDLVYDGNQFSGTVGNTPSMNVGVQLGDVVSILNDEISDWMILDNNRLLGGFTIHVLRNRMSEQERSQFDQSFNVVIPDSPELP